VLPSLVLEAKVENKIPLTGKKQVRKFAKSKNCRFFNSSNGNLHYFWDLQQGKPSPDASPDGEQNNEWLYPYR